MKNLIKFVKSIFWKASTPPVAETLYCNDPILIEDLGKRVKHKEAFFYLYVRCSCESGSRFPVYLALMIRHCRLHMFSLPMNERQSFFEFCLNNKLDISIESLEIANQKERECFEELNAMNAKK